MTIYEYFFGSQSSTAKLLSGDAYLTDKFFSCWKKYRAKHPEVNYINNMIKKEDGTIYCQDRNPEHWLDFLNENIEDYK